MVMVCLVKVRSNALIEVRLKFFSLKESSRHFALTLTASIFLIVSAIDDGVNIFRKSR